MSADRELLELAAKAAGIPGEWDGIGIGILNATWNPLTDDGDALRLAVRLSMKVYPGEAYAWDATTADYRISGCCDDDECIDPYAATRRAIVRAAAAICRYSGSVG